MLNNVIRETMENNSVAAIIISISIMLFLGFALTRITKKLRLPNVTAYILTGILIGPFVLDLIPQQVSEGMDFLSDIALAFIAFSTGEFFTFSNLKKNGAKVVIITVFEACLASVVVFIAVYFILGVDLVFAVVLSALASATAPASTMMTIRQTNARGNFVDTLLQTVALDDVIGLIEYSVAISVALALSTGKSDVGSNVILPILMNLGILVLGGLFGFVLKFLMPQKRSTDNRLIISVSILFAFCGICALLDVSPLLGCMSMGMVYINVSHDEKLFKQLNYFTPPILLLFFVHSGLSFRMDALFSVSTVGSVPLIVVGAVYFLVRIIGKYGGAFLGCLVTRKPKNIRNYLGMALIPQAGVAIGLAAMGARTLGGDTGVALETVILASSVLYELIGPGCSKLALYLSKSYSNKLEDIVPADETDENGNRRSSVDLLIQRIQTIQRELPRDDISEEEKAFTDAAEEQIAAISSIRMDARKRR